MADLIDTLCIERTLPTTLHSGRRRSYPDPQFQCDDCRGRYQGADLRTVPLIEAMTWRGDEVSGGCITDPTNGKSYHGVLTLDGPHRLRVRGFLGVRALGRPQVWRRTR